MAPLGCAREHRGSSGSDHFVASSLQGPDSRGQRMEDALCQSCHVIIPVILNVIIVLTKSTLGISCCEAGVS